MRVLLDTHALLWLLTDDARVSNRARQTFLDTSNQFYFSVASLWEISIKISLGKLRLAENWWARIQDELSLNAIQWLPIKAEHCLTLTTLEFHHRDPFDRMLIAQAVVEGMAVLSRDKSMRSYPVRCIW